MEIALTGSIGMRGMLEKWLALGLAWWLVGMLLVTDSKQYHQLLILLFWLPGLLALVFTPLVRRGWLQPMALVLLAFALWSGISALWMPAQFDARELKIFLYIFLAANAVIMLACLNLPLMRRTLALSGWLVGMLAWVSIIWFYGWEDKAWDRRLTGTGVADHTILAAQLFGAMGVILLYMRRSLPMVMQGFCWLFACAGVLGFLLLSQSKGPWVAAVFTLLVASLWQRSPQLLIALGISVLGGVTALVMWPELILQRGFSYRPELFTQALRLVAEQPLRGLGFTSEYSLLVPSSNKYYEHAHNIYLHIAVTLGLVGLGAWLILQGQTLLNAWQARASTEGRMLCALICFAGIALFTDGVGPWVKPREEWFCLWLPVFLSMGMVAQRLVWRDQAGREQ
ncbi:O-antigen ligase family protein [Pseudomonas borbori]